MSIEKAFLNAAAWSAAPSPDKTDETDKTPVGAGSVGSVGFVGPLQASADWAVPDMSVVVSEENASPEFPGEAVFGPRWSRWILDAAEAKAAPADYVAAALLSTASTLIGNARWAAPWLGWAEPPVVWAMLIGAPSAGKSPALDAILEPLREVERRCIRVAEVDHSDWAARNEAAEIASAAWKEASARAVKEGKEAPPKPDSTELEIEPHIPRLAVQDATVERLAVILSRQPRGTLAIRDELSGWLGNMSRYSSGGSDKPFWLEGYGGRPYVVERMSRDTVRVDRLTLGVLGGIQPDRLASLLLRADDDGMLSRLLPIWPAAVPVKRPDCAPDAAFAERAFDRLYGLDIPCDEQGTPTPRLVPFDADAQILLEEFMRWGRDQENSEATLMVSFIGKTRGLAIRLALILALLEWAGGDDPEPPAVVSVEHLGRSCHLVAEYLVPMARRAYAEAGIPPEERAARQLAGLIVKKGWEAFTLRDVMRLERQGLRRAAEVEPAVEMLRQAVWVVAERHMPGPQGGRPGLIFRVNPLVRA